MVYLHEGSLSHSGVFCLSSLLSWEGRKSLAFWDVSNASVFGKSRSDHLVPFWEVLYILSLEPKGTAITYYL